MRLVADINVGISFADRNEQEGLNQALIIAEKINQLIYANIDALELNDFFVELVTDSVEEEDEG
jgi:hypothetical protein